MAQPNAALQALKSVFAIAPTEQGGVEQRIGASFQDHVAAKYCIEMLSGTPPHQQVWCESHDDIVLVTENGGWKVVFVQAKASLSQGLWKKSDLCKATKNKQGIPKPCIVQRSLEHDCTQAETSFRIVTRENTNSELSPLTHSVGSPARVVSASDLTKLAKYIDGRIGSYKSSNGNDAAFWVERTEIHHVGAENGIAATNQLALTAFAEKHGVVLSRLQCEVLYERILTKVQQASKTKWEEQPADKAICKAEFEQFVIDEITRGGNINYADSARLVEKMKKAGLIDSEIEAALELRRRYLKEVYAPKYLDTDKRDLVEGEVLTRLQVLKANKSLASQLESGPVFHAKCIEAMQKLRESGWSTSPEFMFLGCMYEVTARCRHQFHTELP